MLTNLPKEVRIVEVGPRDGLQNEQKALATEDKLKFIEKLIKAGLKTVEITSFVRPDRIAQMSDSVELYKSYKKDLYSKSLHTPCLVPNLKGLEKAISVGVDEIAIFTATSDSFNQKNINATVDESLLRLEKVSKEALSKEIKIRGYVSTVFGCPYEGETSLRKLIDVCHKLFDLGCYEISLGDTIGVGNPKQVVEIINELKKSFDLSKFSMHFHDTRGMAIANILTSLELGITSFDSSAGGLGGCPYAKGATGNVATEDVVYLMNSMGIKTGIDMQKLSEASQFILDKLDKVTPSKYLKAFLSSGK